MAVFSEKFIRKPIMTTLLMVTALLFGIAAYFKLPVSDLPSVDMPTIEVTVDYPGASPETMANSVATPLEKQFTTIQGLQSMISSSNTGSTYIVLTFDLDRDIDAASTDVQAMISTAQPQLPDNLPNNPTYRKVNPSATPILYIIRTVKPVFLSTVGKLAYEGTCYDPVQTSISTIVTDTVTGQQCAASVDIIITEKSSDNNNSGNSGDSGTSSDPGGTVRTILEKLRGE